MISNPRHGSPPRLMAHQPTRCSTTQESSIRVHRPEPVSYYRLPYRLGGRSVAAPRRALSWLSEHRLLPREIGAEPLFPDKSALPHDGATPNHGEHRPACDLQALIGRVVRTIAQKIMRNHDLLRWIPDHDVRIGSNRNRALARVKPIGLGVIGGGERDEAVEIDASLHHPFGE